MVSDRGKLAFCIVAGLQRGDTYFNCCVVCDHQGNSHLYVAC